jgi:predicted DNA-binding protein
MYNARRSLLRRMERVMKKKIQNAPAITFRLNPELHAELERLAQMDARKLANYVRVVVEKHVREVAAQQSEQAAA